VKTPFICYHKIDSPTPDVKIRGAFTKPNRFERQMLYLKRRGFEFLTASEMIERFLNDGRFPERSISITFDDGWKDNYTNAFPIMKKLSIKATIFLVPDVIGKVTDTVTAEGEGAREHLSNDDVLEMSVAGIEMASHSMSHKLFDRIDEQEISNEIMHSKAAIEDLVQKECKTLAYPAGFYTESAKEMIKKAGYRAAFSTCYGPEPIDLFAINRTEVLRRDGYPFAFQRKIKGLFV
jgi:peptidoglycan/xylan/chitin deacetylase (PgdA/CDA1 family)